MSKEIRFGVIGCGHRGMELCASITNAPNASVAMLTDPRQGTLDELTEFYHVPASTDANAVMSNDDVDAVLIAAPAYRHAELGALGAQENKHVLIHGPLADSLENANDLIDACEKHNVLLGMTYLAQVDPAMNAARDLLRAGILGDIVSIRMTSLRNVSEIKVQDGGVLLSELPDQLNTIYWVTGLDAVSVYAQYDTLTSSADVDDTAALIARFDNGAIGVAQTGLRLPGGAYKDADGSRVYTSKGQLILGSKALIYRQDAPEGSRPDQWQELRYDGGRADLSSTVRGFAQAIIDDAEPPADGYAGLEALRTVLAAYESGHSGKPVEIA